MSWQPGDALEDYEPPETCECEDKYHGEKGCTRPPAEHDGVITSPALCMACLFGCEL